MRRREFLHAAGVGGLAVMRPRSAHAEAPPETRRIRLIHRPALCEAPNYVAEELLRAEGFADVQYVKRAEGPAADALASGDADISMIFATPMILRIDAGDPLVFLAGVHTGCAEIFATRRVRTFRDLKGRTVAITARRDTFHTIFASVAAHVGLRPDTDITWATPPLDEWPQLLAEGKIEAFLAGPQQVQEMRARRIGQPIVNFLNDRPWSQYFCCMVVAHREFVRRHPVAAKRALRAILKASDLCALEPEKAARLVVEKGYVARKDYAVEAMREIAYGRWREFDAADTVRFYSLRLHEAGLIKASPQRILAQGTDWRFLDELKKELKG